MAERNLDDIAAALHGLSAGDGGESTAGEPVEADSPGAAPAPAPPPGAARRRPPGGRPAAPGAPPPPPAAPSARPSIPGARPPSPSRPSVPQLQRQAAPAPPAAAAAARPAGPARPIAPGAPPAADAVQAEVVPVDDAPPIEYRSAPRRPPPRPPFFKTLGFRRTSIPILLSTGVMMLLMGVLRFVVDEASPLAMLALWTTVMLLVAGPVLILLGVANMLHVKKELELGNR
jgi:hypothetical protein